VPAVLSPTRPAGRRASTAARAALLGLARWARHPWEARATQTYAVLLAANALWLHEANGRVARAALRAASTNLVQLRHDPISALLTSAVWLDQHGWHSLIVLVAAFLLVLAPLERRIGTARWLVGFAAGHIGATLIVALGLLIGVHAGLVDASVSRSVDVGWSYGGMALAAVVSYLLPRRARLPYAGVLLAAQLPPLLHPTFTAWGHLTAVAIGLAAGPWLVRRRPALAATAS
jgi:hypothetical protein